MASVQTFSPHASNPERPPQEQWVTATPRALEHIRKELSKRPEAAGFRLSLVRSGCSGWAYQVDFVEQIQDDDLAFPIDEAITLYVDPKSFEAVKGTEIDYVREGIAQRMVFNNPNVTGECGCGESISVD